ncbi:TetR family transcriptional regulator [Rhodoplanes sp. TEM]|uniref:TetR family transcriptional regulator n=1 Tax=Rhodoplanes tepidamans TaxID=200616 RepID=A0ABT5J395_RHOTP|nr:MULTISPECIES: TetR family transcriptional regulator [Rhodoplanes]MDC7784137.1 TetR family transcriptional regulator [Rhodoplanes tepidamans]MDC7983232.1 TetR family transcriptional regulator [Rhodoplanes sp. TEM]MDQ0356765.1 AcrR family transcriptional regulator [Rhodoplanes tepidamans]
MNEARAEVRDSDTRTRIIITADRLYRQIGFQKTTVADIARELGMSPANVYRFFRSKDEINEAVGQQLLGEVIAAAREIAGVDAPAADRLRTLFVTIERMNTERFTVEKKLHDLVALALTENWQIVFDYVDRMDGVIAGIIADGMARGEFRQGDPKQAARCLHTAMIRYSHPRLMVECADFEDPTVARMSEFAIAALR